jgi:hypothetical protein
MTPKCSMCKATPSKRRLQIIACTWFCTKCITAATTHPANRS